MFHFKCWPLVVLVLPPRDVMMNYGGDEEARGEGEIKIYNARAAAGARCRVKIVVA